MRRPNPPSLTQLGCLALVCLMTSLPRTAAAAQPPLAEIQRLLDQGQPEEALALLGHSLPRGKKGAQALLLRSTARIMTGDSAAGEADLRDALELDPELRQGWLNLGAVEIAAQRYAAALAAFATAETLDPSDFGNHLNQGAVLLLLGRVEEAGTKFTAFLAHHGDATSHYLVAGNYALSGHEPQAVEHLRQAFLLDERLRLQVRTDNKFVLLQGEAYRRLLVTDSYHPPADARGRAASFQLPYDRQDGRLLNAVLLAMQQVGEPFDPRIEANDQWALIWGDLRIKLHNQAAGTSVVTLSAPAESMSAATWARRSDALLRAIYQALREF